MPKSLQARLSSAIRKRVAKDEAHGGKRRRQNASAVGRAAKVMQKIVAQTKREAKKKKKQGDASTRGIRTGPSGPTPDAEKQLALLERLRR